MILAPGAATGTQAAALIDASSEEAATRRWTSTNYARAVLCNGLGRHDAALEAAREAFAPDPIGYGTLLVPELAEAASRTGERALLEHALEWLSERTRVDPPGWASGIDARVASALERGRRGRRPLPRVDRAPRRHPPAARARPHPPAVRRVAAPRTSPPRRPRRSCAPPWSPSPASARRHSRAARERELQATGERARKRTVDTRDQLTPQEAQVARLAADGYTNREIAAQLFISPSTVEYHLRKAFRKLGVRSRTQLANRLRGASPPLG